MILSPICPRFAKIGLFLLGIAQGWMHADVPEWTVTSFDGTGVRLEWHGPPLGKSGNPGEYSTAIAIAPGTLASATLVALNGKPSNLIGGVTVSPPLRYRDVRVCAVTWDPAVAAGTGELPNRASIRIAFKPTSTEPNRSAFAPAEETPAEIALRTWIVNYAQSRTLRSTALAGLGKSSAAAPSLSAGLPKERLVIKTTGARIEVLDYATLLKSGAPLSKIDPRKMHLYQNGAEVPLYIEGENDGRWNPGDYLEFIGKRAEGQNSFNSFYTTTATFILTWDGNRLGLRAPNVPVASQTGGIIPIAVQSEKQAKPFAVHEHLEEDVDILRIGSTSAEEIIDLGSRVQETELTDFWVWKRLGVEKDATELPFNLDFEPLNQTPGSGTTSLPGSAGNLQVTINLKGITNNSKADPDHHLKFILNGTDISLVSGVNHDAIWEGQESYQWVSPPLNPSILKAGANVLVVQKVNDLKTIDGQLVDVQDAYINFIELNFPATYKAHNNRIRFSNNFPDSIGTKLFTLTGFTSNAISLWDIQGRKLSNFRITGQGGGYEVRFVDSLDGPTSYLACATSERDIPEVTYDTLPDLLAPAQGADYIVITQSNLLGSALDSLLAHRRKQGLRCAVVLARHIYQTFGDGSMDPAAIRRFTTYAYNNWPRPAPIFLNLVGDASLWFEKRSGSLQMTTVPTHLVNIRGWGVAANDDYFGKVAGDDDVADLFVGRIPVSTVEDLGRVVHKTILLETGRPEGHWHNKTMLIAGYESGFTAQNAVLQNIAVNNDRQFSRLDLFPGSPYYRGSNQRGNFFSQLDSGFNLVSFVGHGGGAVWSDAGVLTLQAIDQGRLQGEFPIPLIASVTCLTGYFEDVAARSLGEELLRLEKGGAANFYGASGYISTAAGEILSSEIMKAATGNGFGTTGAIVNQAETMVKLRTGDACLPVLAEFNLLGDPALQYSFPRKGGTLTLNPKVLAGRTALDIKGSGLAMEQADGVATVLFGDSSESATPINVSQSAFSLNRTLDAAIPTTPNGKVLVHYWNEKNSSVVSAPFSTLDWLIDSLRIEPADAAPGDSISVHLKLNTAYAQVVFNAGLVSFVIGGDKAPLFPISNQIGLQTADGMHLESSSKLVLEVPTVELGQPLLYLAFRMSIQGMDEKGMPLQGITTLNSKTYSLPLSNLPSLELPLQAFHLPIQNDLGVWVTIHNKGLGTATGFQLAMDRDGSSGALVQDTLTYTGMLKFGGLDSLFFPMADSMFHGKHLHAYLIGSRKGELAVGGTTQDTIFQFTTKILASSLDTLRLDTSGTFLTLSSNVSNRRVFVSTVSVPNLPLHLAPATGILPLQAFLIQSPSGMVGDFIIGSAPLGPGLPKISGGDHAYWHYSIAQKQPWLKLDTTMDAGPPWTANGFQSGLYALLLNSDKTGPIIQISSRGQVVLPDDYVPLNTPINVTIRDGQSIDLLLHPPIMTSREQILDSVNLIQESGNALPTLARINFLPKRSSALDSIFVLAKDASGNVSSRSLLYKLGDNLAILNLGSYPNPFADTAVFVFSLTDYCDKVDLKIYSRAGRLVRSLQVRNVVGYQEVVWDGQAEGKREIANGLYFLKVTAKADQRETTRIFKLFKKLRK